MSENYYDGNNNEYVVNGKNVEEKPVQESSVYSYSYINGNPTTDSYTESSNRASGKSSGGKKGPGWFAKTVIVAIVFGLIVSGIFVGAVKLTGSDEMISKSVTSYSTELLSSDYEGVSIANDVSDIVDATMPTVVAITNVSEREIQTWFWGTQKEQATSAGSGVIIAQDDENLYIVTNNHVIEGNIVELTVTFSDSSVVKAEVKGTNPSTDLAIVTVKKSDVSNETLSTIKIAVLGNSEDTRLGESVIVIGNALGYGQSVTTGCVSALERSVTIENNTYTLMQVSAAINPGNSGGALMNAKGELIGITSAKYSDTKVEGMGFAIPISDAKPIIEAIIKQETIAEEERGYLGIYGEDVTESIASVYNMPVGIYVKGLVEGSAAEKAGIKVGDIIQEINGVKIETFIELQTQLQYCKAGQDITVTVKTLKNGRYEDVTYNVTLMSKPETN
ncbi:MAG: trypsin-like peptidase domain-containing protein [Lachnospiraceae bacterium]|nr:trypsin-like peptidase domain-containing protein [Lachnospiraceae bacterium]